MRYANSLSTTHQSGFIAAYHRGWAFHLRPSSATGDEATSVVCLMALRVDVGDDERLAL